MGSPSPSLITSVMQFFVLLSAVSLAFAAPVPEGEEAPAALPYVHDATGDVAEPYVHEEIADVADEIAAVPYVHEEIEAAPYEHDATGDVAEVYTHVEPVVAPVAPVTYAAYPYAGVYTGHPITYTAFPYAVHTGCVNSVGSVVPCAA